MSGGHYRGTVSSSQNSAPCHLHFEALTGHEYEYSCVTCGDHPPIVIMDLHRKGVFNMSCKCVGIDQIEIMFFEQIIHSGWLDTACAYLATGGLYLIFSIIQVVLLIFFPFCMLLVSDIKLPPKDFNGHMDMDDFWDKLALQMIGCGFVKSNSLAFMCLFLTFGMLFTIFFWTFCFFCCYLRTEWQSLHCPPQLPLLGTMDWKKYRQVQSMP